MGHAHRLGSIARLADHFEFRVQAEKHPQALAHHAVIVDK
jgi:hypothetical protein